MAHVDVELSEDGLQGHPDVVRLAELVVPDQAEFALGLLAFLAAYQEVLRAHSEALLALLTSKIVFVSFLLLLDVEVLVGPCKDCGVLLVIEPSRLALFV